MWFNVRALAKYYNMAASTFDFANNAYSITSSIIDRIRSTFKANKTECEGFIVENIILDPKVEWVAYVSTYTTGKNCHTTASTGNQECVKTALANEPYYIASGFCIHIDQNGNFEGDIRFFAKGSSGLANGWALPCAEVGGDWTWTSDRW